MSHLLFPNWIVKHVRNPNLKTADWLKRPVEVFLVSPKMTKIEIAEYLRQLYNMPVTKVHTANYLGGQKIDPRTGQTKKEADYKKAYVYLADEEGTQRPRYHKVQQQLQEEYLQAWPAKPGRTARDLKEQIQAGKPMRLNKKNWQKN